MIYLLSFDIKFNGLTKEVSISRIIEKKSTHYLTLRKQTQKMASTIKIFQVLSSAQNCCLIKRQALAIRSQNANIPYICTKTLANQNFDAICLKCQEIMLNAPTLHKLTKRRG